MVPKDTYKAIRQDYDAIVESNNLGRRPGGFENLDIPLLTFEAFWLSELYKKHLQSDGRVSVIGQNGKTVAVLDYDWQRKQVVLRLRLRI